MDLDQITEKLTQKLSPQGVFRYRALFDFDDEGKVYVDGSGDEFIVSHDDKESDVTLSCSLETFGKILSGDQDPNFAFMTGKLKVRGSMGLALKLNGLLES